jgi:hypothetical protein
MILSLLLPSLALRNFVLNEDLALDYDIGGLAVSATFIISVSVFCVVGYQVWRTSEGCVDHHVADITRGIRDSSGTTCKLLCLRHTLLHLLLD